MNRFKTFLRWLLASLILLLAVLGIGFFLVQTAHAAPASPALWSAVHQTGDPGIEAQIAEFLRVIFEQVNSLTLIPYAVPLVIVLVSLTKRIPQLAGMDAKLLQLFWQVVFWAAAALLIHFGKGESLQQWTELLITFLKMILPGAVSLAAATRGYQYAVNHDVPLLGYQRRSKAPVNAVRMG